MLRADGWGPRGWCEGWLGPVAEGCEVSFLGDEDFLKLIVGMVVYICEYTFELYTFNG